MGFAKNIDQSFDAIVARADAPIWIVTATAGERQAGCLVGFATQVSIEPRRFLVGLSTANDTFTVAAQARHLAVHLLGEEGFALAQLFGSETGADLNKFEHCDWRPGPHGLPILAGAAAWFTGRVLARTDLGDHQGFVLSPTAASDPTPATRGLRYHDVADLEPGQPTG
ncbi:flavin reductase [Nocardia sp. 2]|uniref:Flavin reductase n=1 Tax=Nocardia acididurans TaxID=2802282 RepID=A0ABS1M766_9NOCA|nr:flavin reductase family protein [Nocardia acididurans]MBL1076426.1 flavin reductase [Nocardia acididurans]